MIEDQIEEAVKIQKPRKWTHYLSYAALGTSLTVLLVTLFWLLRPYEVSDVKVPIRILNPGKEIRIGEQILMELEVSKPNAIRPESSVFVECDDGTLVPMVSQVTNLPLGEYTVVNDRYSLPSNVPRNHRCRFHFINSYQVNPIRSITRDWYSETFLTLEAEPDGDDS